MSEHITCADCGVVFCMPDHLAKSRREDHGTFWCPNGHTNYFPGKTAEEKKIEDLEATCARLRRVIDNNGARWNEVLASREDLIGALKECPIPGCDFRSRKQIPRGNPVDMGRGIERVRHDLLEHFVRDHTAQVYREPLELMAGGED